MIKPDISTIRNRVCCEIRNYENSLWRLQQKNNSDFPSTKDVYDHFQSISHMKLKIDGMKLIRDIVFAGEEIKKEGEG